MMVSSLCTVWPRITGPNRTPKLARRKKQPVMVQMPSD